jgi:hypothetical protein
MCRAHEINCRWMLHRLTLQQHIAEDSVLNGANRKLNVLTLWWPVAG